jgi:hypothetical protein
MASRESRSDPLGQGSVAPSSVGADDSASANSNIRQRIGGRYEVVAELGRGGMAQVFCVRDAVSGRSLALKQLIAHADAKLARTSAVLFEREFHTLAQLSHPRVIEVYDYGVDDTGPYYTMELLDGGDLRERTPLPWRQACELLFDVCSSLALLHSRRLVHRDVSPRNVRCTRDGHAKLIDFGAMVPMGIGGQLVGTPPFVAPEVVHGSTLGATFYFALTGRLAYPAQNFNQLLESWSNKPVRPSQIVADIPAALDQLVISLISLEPARRPRSAFEVMQRMAAIAGIQRAEPLSVSKAYLATPSMVGRDELLAKFRRKMQRTLRGQGRDGGLLISAPPGLGRSRMLDACVLEAKTLGASVLRARGSALATADLAAAQVLAQALLEAWPKAALRAAQTADVFTTLFEPIADPAAADLSVSASAPQLRNFGAAGADRTALQSALLRWFLDVSDRHPLLLAVDDVQRIDDASIGLLAALASRARNGHLLLITTVERAEGRPSTAALEVLSTHSTALSLRPLDLAETALLFSSVFGDVPNVGLLSTRIHAVAAGNPRECMALAQHLVDQGSIIYDGGVWALPEKLASTDLPASADEALHAKAALLPPLARRLAEAQSLALHGAFTREEYGLLEPDIDPRQIDEAITELVAQEMVASDGRVYTLAHSSTAAVLCSSLSDAERRERHRTLAEFHFRAGRPLLGRVRHLLLAGLSERGLDDRGSPANQSRPRDRYRCTHEPRRSRAHRRACTVGRMRVTKICARDQRAGALDRDVEHRKRRRVVLANCARLARPAQARLRAARLARVACGE